MAKIYHPLERCFSPLILLPNIIAASLVLLHIRKSKFDSTTTAFLFFSFSLNIIAIVSNMVYMYLRFNGTKCHGLYMVHNFSGLFQMTFYMFAQTEFLFTALPMNDVKARSLVLCIRIFVVTSTLICTGIYFRRCFIVGRDSELGYFLSTTTFYATSVSDVVGLCYMVLYAFDSMTLPKLRHHIRLAITFFISVVVYIVGVIVTYIPSKGHPYFMMLRDGLQLIYLPISYTSLMTAIIIYIRSEKYKADLTPKPNSNITDVERDSMDISFNSAITPSENSADISLENFYINNSKNSQINPPSDNNTTNKSSTIQTNINNSARSYGSIIVESLLNTSDRDKSFHSHCESPPPPFTSHDDTPQCSSSAVMTDRMRAESMGTQSAARQRIAAMKPNTDNI